MFDRRLAGFNYKVLTGILACEYNLYKSKITDEDCCDVCNEAENIHHLIYLCPYAISIWEIIEHALDIKLSLHDIIVTDRPADIVFIITLISFLIYKEKHICRTSKTARDLNTMKNFFYSEFAYRKAIYALLGYEAICDKIDAILNIILPVTGDVILTGP